jgi:hypothetical protein
LSTVRRHLVAVVATVSVGAALSGCAGSASPGVAVDVDGETISVADVDRAAAAVCTSLEPDLRGASNTVAMTNVQQYVVSLLTAAEQARRLADEHGVDPGAEFSRAVAQSRQTAKAFPEETRDDYVEVMSAEPLVNAVVDAVGRASLAQDGIAEPTVEQVAQRGQDLFTSWPDQHPVEVDPRYGLAMDGGQLRAADTNLSVAVGEVAKAASAAEPDPVYARTLPAGQRCG